jgi:hypothetical protein
MNPTSCVPVLFWFAAITRHCTQDDKRPFTGRRQTTPAMRACRSLACWNHQLAAMQQRVDALGGIYVRESARTGRVARVAGHVVQEPQLAHPKRRHPAV